MTTPPSKQLDQFVVRLPDGMRDRIKAAAEKNNRSMNAEIVSRLEGSFDHVAGIKSLKTKTGIVMNPTLSDIVHDAVEQTLGKLYDTGALVVKVDVERDDGDGGREKG